MREHLDGLHMQESCRSCGAKFEANSGGKYCNQICQFNYLIIKRPNGCWDARCKSTSHGYIRFRGRRNAKSILAHRLSFEMYRGPVPKDVFVLHTCDNPRCTNPEHLFLGSKKDNAQDCIAKGRFAYCDPSKYRHIRVRGEKHHSAKLTEDAVRTIRSSSEGPTKLASKFGVNRQIIWRIRKRSLWKCVTD
jgi:HNH endonuclease